MKALIRCDIAMRGTLVLNISPPVISNYWYLKVNFLEPEKLLRDISSSDELRCRDFES